MSKDPFSPNQAVNPHAVFEYIYREVAELVKRIETPGIISEEEQQSAIERLKKSSNPAQLAFFSVDIASGRLSNVNGIERLLGMSGIGFTMRDYMGTFCNSADLKIQLAESAALVFNCLKGVYVESKFLKGTFTACHGMRRSNGEEIYVLRTSHPFQVTQQGNITEYLSIFHLIGKYTGQPYTSGAYNVPEAYYEELKIDSSILLNRKYPLSPKQIQIAKYHLKNGFEESAIEVSNNLRMPLHTYQTLRKRIREKTIEYSSQVDLKGFTFQMAIEVIQRFGIVKY